MKPEPISEKSRAETEEERRQADLEEIYQEYEENLAKCGNSEDLAGLGMLIMVCVVLAYCWITT